MLLLAADTSGKQGSIGLARCGPDDSCEIIEVAPLAGGTFSAQLVPQIAALLGQHSLSKGDIGGFAVVSGPGSFTGLRVGLAAIKALAEVLHAPIAAVSLLEAVASLGPPGRVLAAVDAGRGEIYAGDYEVGREITPVSERLLTREEFVRAAAAAAAVVTPDRSIGEAARASTPAVYEIDVPRSDTIARLGWRKIRAGLTVSPEILEANYIRRSDAEIFAKPDK